METPIVDMLGRVSGEARLRFCMPGHKGKAGFLPEEVHRLDITELSGADNLYHPQEAIKKSQKLHAEYIDARESYFMVNGGSCGVQASVLSVLEPGDTVIVARDIHLSAVNAFIMADVKPVFVYPSARETDVPCVVSVQDIASAVALHKKAKAVYLTYPNYYGLCADLNGICAVAHEAGMKVICDAAHAAAFDFSGLLPVTPAHAGCDIWTCSLHKTLGAMNQCAVLSAGVEAGLQPEVIQSRLNMLQTTSPSYLLLASSDYTLGFMRREGKQKLHTVIQLVEENMRRIEALGGYRCIFQDIPKETGAFDRDILRLVIDVTDRGVSGFGAARFLQEKGIAVETADIANIVLICTAADTAEDFEALKAALGEIKGSNYKIRRMMTAEDLKQVYLPQISVPMRKAFFAERRSVALEESIGCIAAVPAGAYPPGVPVILPGQKIAEDMVDYLTLLKNRGYGLFGIYRNEIEIACF
ncbi:aminotransferase class I/II-fold pyridoxal phosphate-dependent enzyme [Christensenella tenuis]|jgi:arginine/lysine/ornithine decarboxylase|uniref:Aminotransferase class V-fold PLP-dependent enzyme n=1 Tax=Christensenella tenuis TaxID=2763033 RepID=A0ABR7EAH5_9FIRM|nr:aminotransferase class V-fold PLP-dependent enzyme [Christensenella tenuis]MBC5646796.1 aminotransferase class V-fold PLP-dependent enzyme [Christensenella tenuis]